MEKKVVLFVALLVILFLLNSFVYAVDNGVNDNTVEDSNLPVDIGQGVEGVKDIGSKTQSTLEQDVTIPESLQVPARIIFGIEGEISFSVFIILICLWIFLFLIITSGLHILLDGWRAWVAGLAVTCLLAVTGAIKESSIFIFHFFMFGGLLKNNLILSVIISIIVIAFIFWGLFEFLKMLSKNVKTESAEAAGMEAGAGIGFMRRIYNRYRKTYT